MEHKHLIKEEILCQDDHVLKGPKEDRVRVHDKDEDFQGQNKEQVKTESQDMIHFKVEQNEVCIKDEHQENHVQVKDEENQVFIKDEDCQVDVKVEYQDQDPLNTECDEIEQGQQSQESPTDEDHDQAANTLLQERFGCEMCGYSTRTLRQLTMHATRVHTLKRPRHSCDICNYRAVSLEDLDKHKFEEHVEVWYASAFEEDVLQKWDVCSRIGVSDSHLKQHKETEQSTSTQYGNLQKQEKTICVDNAAQSLHREKSSFCCYQCEYTTHDFKDIKKHKRSHKRVKHNQ